MHHPPGERQAHGEGAAPVRRALHAHRPAVRGDQVAGDGEAQAQPLGVMAVGRGAVERLKDALLSRARAYCPHPRLMLEWQQVAG